MIAWLAGRLLSLLRSPAIEFNRLLLGRDDVSLDGTRLLNASLIAVSAELGTNELFLDLEGWLLYCPAISGEDIWTIARSDARAPSSSPAARCLDAWSRNVCSCFVSSSGFCAID